MRMCLGGQEPPYISDGGKQRNLRKSRTLRLFGGPHHDHVILIITWWNHFCTHTSRFFFILAQAAEASSRTCHQLHHLCDGTTVRWGNRNRNLLMKVKKVSW